jgi:hypothetical protein
MGRQRTRRNLARRRIPARQLLSNNVKMLKASGQLLVVGTLRMTCPREIPVWTENPKVQRWIRARFSITSTQTLYTITAVAVSNSDSSGYLGATTPRYSKVRLLACRAWAETPPLTITQDSFALTGSDAVSGVYFTDRGVPGQSYPSVAFRFCLATRQVNYSVGDTTPIANFNLDAPVPAGGAISLTVDTLVEFA